jgi:integrase/recombinase XerC
MDDGPERGRALVQVQPGASALQAGTSPVRVWEAWVASLRPATRRGYVRDLEQLARSLDLKDVPGLVAWLVQGGRGRANAAALDWSNAQVAAGRSSATVRRRLSALRALVRQMRVLGLVEWEVEVPAVRGEPQRETRGPGASGVGAMLEVLGGDGRAARRDRAVVRLLYDLALRRAEVASLDVCNLQLAGDPPHLLVRRKGRDRLERRTLPPETQAAIEAWLEVRGRAPGPLFHRLDRATPEGHLEPMDGSSIYRMVRSLGDRALVRARPHGLRHAAITEALEVTGGNVRAVQRFAGHANPTTTMVYDDERRDIAGEVARSIAKRKERP